jgi:hypothetical protein
MFKTARIAVFCAAAALAATPILHASDYFLDSEHGNDDAKGLSARQAWKTLAKINALTCHPGDRILLKSGCVFMGQLAPKGSGAPGKPIVIDRYGEGDRPVIDGGGSSDVIQASSASRYGQ